MHTKKMLSALLSGIILVSFTSKSTAEANSGLSTNDYQEEILSEENNHDGWNLKYSEDFSTKLTVDLQPWVRDDYEEGNPWYVDGELDNNGNFFKIKGKGNLQRHLDSFWLMRKRVSFGEDGWLSADLATRDYTKTGKISDPVTFTNVELDNGEEAALLNEPSFDGGGLIRSTDPLPPEYRIEYRLKTVDFGGMRNGSFEYDGKVNGIEQGDAVTNFPWKASGSYEGPSDPRNPNFDSASGENGYYFLTIVDYHDPAPYNNVFIHSHRKVGMDAYNVKGLWSDPYRIVNPRTKELYEYNSDMSTRNGINAIFMNGDEFKDHVMPYNEFIMETEAGLFEGEIVSIAEIQPELMPEEDYLFAIEKDKTGYTMEVTGNFLHAGHMTLKYKRDFIQDGKPIAHYNNRPDQYDGQFNHVWDDGEYRINDTWPEGSAYPDYFIIGDPHLTHYEGSATIDDIKLFVPEEIDADYLHTIVWQLNDLDEIDNDVSKTLIDSLKKLENTDDKEKASILIDSIEQTIEEARLNKQISQKANKELEYNLKSLRKSYN